MKTSKIEVKNQDLLTTLEDTLESILALDNIDALLAPQLLPMKNVVMPILITNSDQLEKVDPLAPSFPINSAKLVSKLTRKPSGSKIAVILRSCEIRAFIELNKLKQGQLDDVVMIGIDCLGAYDGKTYTKYVEENGPESTQLFYKSVLLDQTSGKDELNLSAACQICEKPIADGADISIGLYGMDFQSEMLLQAKTEKGVDVFDKLGLAEVEEPSSRKEAVDKLIAERSEKLTAVLDKTAEMSNSVEKLTQYLARCVNCYNCRVACPVCYCKECVMVTDVFDHEPVQYLQWADQRGNLKMPTDTVFYHITRMTHMSLACVGCGQCSNACPNDIPLVELFRATAERTQKSFEYEAGKDIDEPPPMSIFQEDEYSEVVGIVSQSE